MITIEDPNQKLNLGKIKIENYLPEIFKDEGIREQAEKSIEDFTEKHEGELPLKFRIQKFCFDREHQICTADSSRKYIAWSGENLEMAKNIFSGLNPEDLPVLLRTHAMEFGMQAPTLEITEYVEVARFLAFLEDQKTQSIIRDDFFSKINLPDTIIELVKNPYKHEGLFLCRPFFIYDESLRQEVKSLQPTTPQDKNDNFLSIEAPREFVGIRVFPVEKNVREKKERMGTIFMYNLETKKLEIRDGYPHGDIYEDDDLFGKHGPRHYIGRTLNPKSGYTILHYSQGPDKIAPQRSVSLNDGDGHFLAKVLEYQLPRIIEFEKEIRKQDWIPRGATNTHQFVIFPPQEVGELEINTQYFDFRPHESADELNELASKAGKDFSAMNTEEKIEMFF